MIKFKKLTSSAVIPTRGSEHAAAFDLYTPFAINLMPRKVTKVPIGIASEFPHNMVAQIWDRSGLGSKGLKVHGGVIDSDYRGEWVVCLCNHNSSEYQLYSGDRIAQVMFVSVFTNLVEVFELNETDRGSDGFGSTGQ